MKDQESLDQKLRSILEKVRLGQPYAPYKGSINLDEAITEIKAVVLEELPTSFCSRVNDNDFGGSYEQRIGFNSCLSEIKLKPGGGQMKDFENGLLKIISKMKVKGSVEEWVATKNVLGKALKKAFKAGEVSMMEKCGKIAFDNFDHYFVGENEKMYFVYTADLVEGIRNL